MKVESVLITGPPGTFPPALEGAVREAFPHAATQTLPGLSAAGPPWSGAGLELLVLSDDAAMTGPAAAEEMLDAEGLPRWGVLRFGGDDSTAAWTHLPLVRFLRGVADRHALSRENTRLRGDLLTIARRISHDLRTPLGGIIATVDMLAETIPSGIATTKPVFSSIDEITKIITRTSFLLKAIAQPLPRKPLNMGTAVREALARLERPILQTQAELRQPESWPDITGVAPWLEMIWWNLIHNALQHSGPSPVITMGWEEENNGHRFWIRDTGPAGPLQRTLGAFHLLHDPNASPGLGLPIVRRLTELQGGSCGYTAEAGGSANWYFILPES